MSSNEFHYTSFTFAMFLMFWHISPCFANDRIWKYHAPVNKFKMFKINDPPVSQTPSSFFVQIQWRTDAFKLWCWKRLLRVPWTARRSNLSVLKKIIPEYSLEGLMLKLNVILWPPNAKSPLIGKDPDAGEDWGQEEKGETENEKVGWHHLLSGHEFEQTEEDSER